MRLREVRWEQYQSSPASKKHVPKILENLASRKEARAMKASHDLWLALCSGGVYPAAEPCFPFLMEILAIAGVGVQAEILDVLLSFAKVPNDDTAEDWQRRLRMLLAKEHRFLTKLGHNQDTIVADKAVRLLGVI